MYMYNIIILCVFVCIKTNQFIGQNFLCTDKAIIC